MSESGRVRSELAARLAPILREWALLRERERDLFLRAAEALESVIDPEFPAGAAPAESRSEPPARAAAAELPAEGPPGAAMAGSPGEAAAGATMSGSPAQPPAVMSGAEAPAAHSWIDQTIDAVLAGAFSAEIEEETDEPPAVDLLLMRSGGTWVGIPWDRVAALGLSEDPEPPGASPPLSLGATLAANGSEGGDDGADEPYRLSWESARGTRALSCAVLGGVVAAPAAAARGVNLVWLPDDSEPGGRLLPLVEFLAAGWRGDLTGAAEEPRAPLPEPPAVSQAPEDARRTPEDSPRTPADAPQTSKGAPTTPEDAQRIPVVEPSASPASPVPVAGPPPSLPADAVPAGLPATFGVPASPATRPTVPEMSENERSPRPGLDRLTWGRGARATSRAGLVAVRYLPARVAIARALRAHGWFVLEAADPEELPSLLHRIHHTAVFAEVPDRPEPGWIHALMRAREAGTRIIGVASRLRGASADPFRAFGTLPRLLYPFQDLEVERLIQSPETTEDSGDPNFRPAGLP